MSDLKDKNIFLIKCRICGTEQSSEGELYCTSCGEKYGRYCLLHEIWDVDGHCPECKRIEDERKIVADCIVMLKKSSREEAERFINDALKKHGSFPELTDTIKKFRQKNERIDFLKSFIYVLEKQNNLLELAKCLEELVSLDPANIGYREKLARAEIYLGRVR